MSADQPAIDDMARRLGIALERPLTDEVWPGLAGTVLERFADVPLMDAFAEKALETLNDGERHDRLAVSPEEPQVAAWFVAFNGTHREVQPERYGEYLPMLLSTAQHLVERGIELAGFLELDAYLRDEGELEVDLELSFLPGVILGYPEDKPTPFPAVFQVNGGLCTPEELQRLRGAMA